MEGAARMSIMADGASVPSDVGKSVCPWAEVKGTCRRGSGERRHARVISVSLVETTSECRVTPFGSSGRAKV